MADLESLPWREAAAKIEPAAAERIKADARRGDAFAGAVACLGHMAGADGFLPSPAAARDACDAASAESHPAALYLSWEQSRATPHLGIDSATARQRLSEAARLGWLPAQIDYALLLANNFRGPVADQVEAGRLFLAAAERGDPRGQYQYARWLRDSPAGPRDPGAAIPFLDRAAQRGQLEATHMLATLYRDGQGAPRNAARARELYERAAARAHAPSMFNLADMLRSGPPEDRARAATLYRSLACLRDNRPIQTMAQQRLRGMREAAGQC